MRARAYVRCSTAEQATSGLGLEAQTATVEAEARRLGAELVGLHSDAGLSGSLPMDERPGLLEAVNELRRGDVLIVARRDRLGRDVVGVALVERLVTKKGARIVSAAGEGSDMEAPSGPLVKTIIDAVNSYERSVLALRTRVALKAKRRRGERAGATPYGFALGEDGRTLVPVTEEQDVIQFILSRHARGVPLRAIADELNARNVRARRGGAWWHSSVISVIRTHARHAA